MGIAYNAVSAYMYAQKRGVDFSQTLMLGRQNFSIPPDLFSEYCQRFEISLSKGEIDKIFHNEYAESFLEFLGAKQVDSIDMSSYETATIQHDMNTPIPPSFHEQYSCVIDGGTLEHVFNVPQALKNAMQMVKLGGHFISANITNGYSGHGFYQFSPEFYFSTLNEEQGFSIEAVFVYEPGITDSFYRVMSPKVVKERVEPNIEAPLGIFVIAKRVKILTPFESVTPQQSDYILKWTGAPKNQHEKKNSFLKQMEYKIKHYIKQCLPQSFFKKKLKLNLKYFNLENLHSQKG